MKYSGKYINDGSLSQILWRALSGGVHSGYLISHKFGAYSHSGNNNWLGFVSHGMRRQEMFHLMRSFEKVETECVVYYCMV